MTKKELRQLYKSKRLELSESGIEHFSLAIANALLAIPIWDKTYFHVFLPITEHNEVNTQYIIHALSAKDKKVLVSKSDFESREMIHFLLTDSTKILKNKYNIPEPTNGIDVSTTKIEVVFVPLLAFDKKGNRVGYGKGFYDTFLSKCQPETIKIGLSFFTAEEEIDDLCNKDVALNYCVTPKEIYNFQS